MYWYYGHMAHIPEYKIYYIALYCIVTFVMSNLYL